MISIVVAYSNNRVIGKDNKMPWDIKGDLEFFKNLTMGNIIIMGRRTYESIGRALPGRINIVISRKIEKQNKEIKEKIYFTSSLEDAIYLAKSLIKKYELVSKNHNNQYCDENISSKNQKEELNLIKSVEDRVYSTQSFEENKENEICYNSKIKYNDETKQGIHHVQYSQDEEYLFKNLEKDKEIKIDNINLDSKSKLEPKEIFIIGGQSIYEQSIDIADKIYVTKIDFDYSGDKYFPYFDKDKYSSKILKNENLPVKHTFILYEKI